MLSVSTPSDPSRAARTESSAAPAEAWPGERGARPPWAASSSPPAPAPASAPRATYSSGLPSAGFHRYWVRRSPDAVTIGIDDLIEQRFSPADLPPGASWVFNDQPVFAIISLAVGGGWAGSPASTVFPQTMVVDSFRYRP